jgi:dolichyl-phosphate-mannose-protein mannosyltransferase
VFSSAYKHAKNSGTNAYPTTRFDEVHFGKFAGYYLKRTYYFDVHPPLAKLMIAGAGYLLGFDGQYDFANIGDNYLDHNVPYIGLRSLPATLNVLCVAFIYLIMKESGYSLAICVLSAAMYIFDNAMVTQNRLILLDSMLLIYMLATIYTYIRFRKLRHRSFSPQWWFWLIATGVCMALTVRYVINNACFAWIKKQLTSIIVVLKWLDFS